jgi:toxin ParE1/3/4
LTSRYVLSADAQADLDEIAEYIARDKAQAARKFILKLKAKFRLVAANPHSGERYSGEDGLEYRRLSAWNYVIYYRFVDKRVLIARVVHGYRNLAPSLKCVVHC